MKRVSAALAIAVGLAALPAAAQEYPAQDIKLVYGYAAGSGGDLYVRYFAEKMRPLAGRPIIVENRPGASGNIGAEYVARSKPDGYTINMASGNAMASSLYLYKTPPYNPLRDFQMFGTVLNQGFMVMVDARSSIRSMADLTAYLKQKGAKGTYAASTPIGIVMGELYKQKAGGLETVRADYRAIADSLNDLLGGTVDVAMADPVFGLAQINAGRLRGLAISTPQRMGSVPDMPTLVESGLQGLELPVWWGAVVPSGTPAPVIAKLSGWLNAVLRMPETKEMLSRGGADPFITSPEEAQRMLERDVKVWGEYIRQAKIEPMG